MSDVRDIKIEDLSPEAQTRFVEVMADTGLPLPTGPYQLVRTITVPDDYDARARAAGRTDDEDGSFPFAHGCYFQNTPKSAGQPEG